ncbi:MAG: phosphotransferase [Deltaproteobacteria bacterium]|nr:phosphotransferase [Deltaproteobacteria bacterium]
MLRMYVARAYPGRKILAIQELAPDTGATRGSTTKVAGYGQPMRIVLDSETGAPLELVWRVTSSNDFGHDRRSDRAALTIQEFDDFRQMPRHVQALDLGVVTAEGDLHSIHDSDELYLVTTYAPGTVYAEDLRRIATTGVAGASDLARLTALATYLDALHTPLGDPTVRYQRAIRDLVGSGEGIFGIVDGYPADVPGASGTRLRGIEEACATWRWRLRGHGARLVRSHGDFHPFNIVFTGDSELTLLDASRGACGDPADDVTALAVNFVLFALGAPDAWPEGLGVLWHRWWAHAQRSDPGLLETAPPFFAWRALVVANPRFYPNLDGRQRDRLLSLAEEYLEELTVDPHRAEELFT